MATPLRTEIQQGKALKETMKKMATPLREENQQGKALNVIMKKMASPLCTEIRQGKALKETKKNTSPLQEEQPAGRKILTAKRKYSQRDYQEDVRLVTLSTSSTKVQHNLIF